MKKRYFLFLFLLVGLLGFPAYFFIDFLNGLQAKTNDKEQTVEKKPKPVRKTSEEWRKVLTPEQYRILREAGTEPPNGKVYQEFKHHGAGTYFCAGCDTGTVFLQRKIRFQVRMALLLRSFQVQEREQLPLIGTWVTENRS